MDRTAPIQLVARADQWTRRRFDQDQLLVRNGLLPAVGRREDDPTVQGGYKSASCTRTARWRHKARRGR